MRTYGVVRIAKEVIYESAEQVYNDIKPTKEQKEYERLDVNPDDLPF